MSKESRGVDRRAFIAGIATASAGAAAAGVAGPAPAEAAGAVGPAALKVSPPSAAVAAADTGSTLAVDPTIDFPAGDKLHVSHPGSDYMVDVVRNLPIDYIIATPGSTFRGIQESFVNYGENVHPEWITVHHEEISAALAHGYAKVTGKPAAIIVHDDVGLQHASMALYNAWCDRVGMLVLVGNILDGATRRPGVEWDHTAIDPALMVRGYIKYDDSPVSLDQFRESTTRGYSIMTTPPFGSALIVVDADLAENPMDKTPLPIAPYHPVRPPVGDPGAVAEIAKLLVGAQNPLIVTSRFSRTPAGPDLLVKLAELLEIPVIDTNDRVNMPTNHYLYQSFNRSLVGQADVVLALEVGDLFGILGDVPDNVGRPTVLRVKPGTKVAEINSELLVGAGNYQDKQRFFPSDIPVAADAEATLPLLIDAIASNLTDARRALNPQRAAHFKEQFRRTRAAAREAAAIGWNASPITPARLCAELWSQIKTEDWAYVSQSTFLSNWPQRTWDFTKTYQGIGVSGGGGVGYQMPAAVGAALGHKGSGRLVVNIVGDGELLMLPGSLWTLAHHRIPMLTIVHNNRAWHQEHMHVQRIANRRDRDVSRSAIGTVITDPNVDYAYLAKAYGVYGEGPIDNPDQLASAIERAIKIVKSGRPALLDVVTQPR
jgi:thiamine pyrophosphate-dependent acetolactate synthase large subunit-like protein